MNMRPEEGELDDFGTFSDRCALDECIEERSRRAIDHRPAP